MNAPLISVRDLTVQFDTAQGRTTAVNGVSFDIAPGEILGLVGESGSGKSVTARSLMNLNPGNVVYGPDSRIGLNLGSQEIDVLTAVTQDDLLSLRGGAVSMIFQQSMAGFAPAHTIGFQMCETLRLHQKVSRKQAKSIAIDMLARVGIPDAAACFDHYVFQLSAGVRQRAMIALALSTKPKLLIADDATRALDVTLQAQVLDLMQDLVEEYQMAILFITHDLGLCAKMVDRMVMMYLGEQVETGPVREILRHPQHPYTRGLIRAIPKLDDLETTLTPMPGSIPGPLERPDGCVFHTRCREIIAEKCTVLKPETKLVTQGHNVACFAVQLAVIPKNSQDNGEKSGQDEPVLVAAPPEDNSDPEVVVEPLEGDNDPEATNEKPAQKGEGLPDGNNVLAEGEVVLDGEPVRVKKGSISTEDPAPNSENLQSEGAKTHKDAST